MIKRSFRAAGTTAVVIVSLTGILALSACEERPYPTDSRSYSRPVPPPPLAGAPSYAPPPAPVYAPPPPPAYSYAPPPPRAYDAPAIVAMAPIPNPGDVGSDGYYAGRRVHTRLYGEGYAPEGRRPVYRRPAPVYAARPAPSGYAGRLTPTGPIRPYTPPKDYKPVPPPAYAAARPPVAASRPSVVSTAKATYNDNRAPVGAPDTPTKVGQDVTAAGAAAMAAAAVAGQKAAVTAKTAADDAKAAYNANKPAVAPVPAAPAPAAPAPASGADRSTRLATLQSALTDAVSKTTVLGAPDRFTANQPADVTLTVPKGFADTLRTEAQKDGLSDAAASVNITAVLSGDGFSVTPDETQSQPLTIGQDTVFRWTVTAQPGAKGPLHADVGADLLGGGSDTLALGSVQKSAGMGVKLNARVVGASILVLIAALVVVWLARGRGGPSRSASARRASRNARGGARPLDMGGETPQ